MGIICCIKNLASFCLSGVLYLFSELAKFGLVLFLAFVLGLGIFYLWEDYNTVKAVGTQSSRSLLPGLGSGRLSSNKLLSGDNKRDSAATLRTRDSARSNTKIQENIQAAQPNIDIQPPVQPDIDNEYHAESDIDNELDNTLEISDLVDEKTEKMSNNSTEN